MKMILPLLCGVLTGVLSAWGIGGGTLLLLCMTLLLGVDQQTAQAINLLYFLPVAAVALYLHRKNDFLDMDALRHAAPWSAGAALAVSVLAQWLDPRFLRRPFGLLLLYAGICLLCSGKDKPDKKENE